MAVTRGRAARPARPSEILDSLVRVTLQHLDELGESGLRLDAIADAAGVSPAEAQDVVGDLDRLVDAARLHRFSRNTDGVVSAVRARLATVTSHLDLVRALPAVVALLHDADDRVGRSRHLANLAAALGRPGLALRISEVQRRAERELAAVLDDLTRRHVIAPDVDCLAVATFMQAVSAGQLMTDADLDPDVVERVDQTLLASLRSLLHAPASMIHDHPPTAVTPRGQTTARALLDAARRQIATRSEQGFRIDEILAEVGVSPSSLYHHFGGREGLMEAAWIDWFREQADADVQYVADVLERSTTRSEFVTGLVQVVLDLQSPSGEERRVQRLMAYAAAVRHPGLRAEIGRLENETNQRVRALLDQAREQGLLDDLRHIDMLPVFARALSFGRVTNELSVEPIDNGLWNAAVGPVMSWLLGGDDPALG